VVTNGFNSRSLVDFRQKNRLSTYQIRNAWPN
jgi:hypothetical protein